MGRIKEQATSALDFMPVHRTALKRRRTLNLDLLLEDARAIEKIDSGTLDFILMGYRYYWVFKQELTNFVKKPVSPPELEDLLQIGFAALMTRTQIPLPVITHELVDAASEAIGPFTKGICNAFFRHVLREKARIEKSLMQNPQKILGPKLPTQLGDKLSLPIAKALRLRPEPGIAAFDTAGIYLLHPVQDFLSSNKTLQAMDPGSWEFSQWMLEKIKVEFPPGPLKILDACAAPGGKLLALYVLLKKAGYKPVFHAVEAKQARQELLQQNLRRFGIDKDVSVELSDWKEPVPNINDIDVLLLDLPCTGSGTLHTRPDLLLEDLELRQRELLPAQTQIIKNSDRCLKKGGLKFVSLCSILPIEIAGISMALSGYSPEFSSWEKSPAQSEGITAWRVKK